MPLRPPRGRDILLHENEEVTVNILPTVLEVRERRKIAPGAIRVTHKTRVHLGMDPPSPRSGIIRSCTALRCPKR